MFSRELLSLFVFEFLNRSLESLSDESAILESEPASLGLGPVFDVKYVQDVARMVAIDDTNCVQVRQKLHIRGATCVNGFNKTK